MCIFRALFSSTGNLNAVVIDRPPLLLTNLVDYLCKFIFIIYSHIYVSIYGRCKLDYNVNI